jgi:hypothetical protein
MSNVCCHDAVLQWWINWGLCNIFEEMSLKLTLIFIFEQIIWWMSRGSKHGFTHHNWVSNLSLFVQVTPYLLIFDNGCLHLRMKRTLELYFNGLIGCRYPENMGLDTKIESVTSLIFKLYHIYWFPIMAACSHLGFQNEGDIET